MLPLRRIGLFPARNLLKNKTNIVRSLTQSPDKRSDIKVNDKKKLADESPPKRSVIFDPL